METEQREMWRSEGPAAAAEVRVPKASERIAHRLRGQIVRGEIEPGQMLPPEKTLMVQLGVSRPTLREAFRILESEGLITVVTGSRGGPRARLPDLDVASRHIGLYLQIQGTTLEDVLEARAEFESACVRLLARRCPPEGLESLRRCVDAHRQRVAAGLDSEDGFVRWVALTAEFHELISLNCGNKTLNAQVSALRDVLDAHRTMGIRQRVDDADAPERTAYAPSVVEDYQKLVDLVAARDAVRAERHWRTHLKRASEIIYRSRDRTATISLFD
ncbi:FadR family transcriptional regulator [Rhodococcoides fascians A25f]|uniref:FadR/GntR family transcriptional regulator n=1 Tax=Rhodococcoides fascians TaxID=1828 RepID=UPI00068FE06B|nr:FCD domain-containing protein [Rhodococcus fascians]QII07322.1 FadR family transcriptional regulator [Rhodococcus fascians A25f]